MPSKGGFLSAAKENGDGGASSASSSSALDRPSEEASEKKSLLTVDGSGGGISAETAKEMCEELRADIHNLSLLEEDESERLEAAAERQSKIAMALDKTVLKIKQKRSLLQSLEGPTHTCLLIKQLQVQEAGKKASELKLLLKELEENTERECERMRDAIAAYDSKAAELNHEIFYLEKKEHDATVTVPPGPYCLRHLESDWYHLVSSMVIMSNAAVIFLEMTHPDLNGECADDFYLVFYVVELVLFLILKRRTFFFCNGSIEWWNVLDVAIVMSSLFEFTISHMAGVNLPFLGGLRVMRLFRLLRLARIVKVFMADMSWADSPHFHTFMMGVILLNSITMGLECEYKGLLIWEFLNVLFLGIYLFEIVANMKHSGWRFFYGPNWYWNWLDLIIVGGGMVYMAVLPAFNTVRRMLGQKTGRNKALSQAVTILRMVRLVRIVRLVKLVRSIPPLYTLVIGIAKAMQGMGWVMVLTITVLYTCALVGVKMVGDGDFLPDLGDREDEVRKTFDNIPDAIFNLFKVMNADLGGVEPLLEAIPSSKYIMMLFMIFTNWAIFSILTAVVSDNMAKVTEQHNKEVEEEEERDAKELRDAKMELLFKRLDINKDGRINLEEFCGIKKEEEAAIELERISGIPQEDFEDLFEAMAHRRKEEEEDTIGLQEITVMMDQARDAVTICSIAKLERRLARMEEALVLLVAAKHSKAGSSGEVQVAKPSKASASRADSSSKRPGS